MTALPPPGWYPDPSDPSGHRWWDGAQWTANTQPAVPAPTATATATAPVAPAVPAQPAPAAAPGYGTPAYGAYGAPAPMAPGFGGPGYGSPYAPQAAPMGSRTLWQANRYTLITLGIVAAYLVLAVSTGIVFIGILPVAMSIRAFQAKERLAPVAVAGAVIAVIVAIAVLTHH